MLKKTARDIIILFGLFLLWASTSRPFMKYITDLRDGNMWWGTYPCLHGDLVSLSYLDFVTKFNPPPVIAHLSRAPETSHKNTVLVLHGDSNTWHVADSNFSGVSTLYYINRTNGGYYHLDTSKRNIMVIEVSERYLRSYFGGLQIFDEVHDTGEIRKSAAIYLYRPATLATYASAIPPIALSDFFNKYINQNLQCNLFNYNFIMPMFESKAALNYYLFNRASGDVVISDDRNRLFLKETVTKNDIGSSYIPVPGEDIQRIVENLNNIYDHYRKLGFREVYFSIIPNAATIMQPAGYNGLIPAIQNARGLRMKMIDIYSVFKNSSEVYYLPGDTHWNMAGKQLWIDVVNHEIMDDQH